MLLYCLRDKKKVDVDPVEYKLDKNGRPRALGTCPICNGAIYTYIKVVDAPPELQKKIAANKGTKKSKN